MSLSYLRPTTKDQHNYEYKRFGFKIRLQQENKNIGLIIFKDFDNNNIVVPSRIKLVDLQDDIPVKHVTYNGISCLMISWTESYRLYFSNIHLMNIAHQRSQAVLLDRNNMPDKINNVDTTQTKISNYFIIDSGFESNVQTKKITFPNYMFSFTIETALVTSNGQTTFFTNLYFNNVGDRRDIIPDDIKCRDVTNNITLPNLTSYQLHFPNKYEISCNNIKLCILTRLTTNMNNYYQIHRFDRLDGNSMDISWT
ncbi:17271_t:CDS:2 [Cetraspora pellucida]|uniref:17271_t:CDS:1 n=1 Tax=Cetraspora pellucida TaxID=1433469 RepID=A0ACA9LH93_9GLOM|nr:17271_t:CDS:2 [Cetraspora pellucida]